MKALLTEEYFLYCSWYAPPLSQWKPGVLNPFSKSINSSMKQLSLVLMLALFSISFAFGQRNISGQVTDTEGEPLIGASVLVQGTSSGTVTDIDGNFQVEVPEGASTLIISYTGFASQEVEIGNSDVLQIAMEQSASQLAEIVVTGYGETSKRLNTTSIASVGTEALQNIPVQSVEQALQGRLAGVNITGASGTLGSTQAIRVRGTGSINADNQPLYVVDGLILNQDNGSQNALGGPGTNPLLNLDPNEIESIDVLKDAAAQALYGARGSNGVILINTKKGRFNQAPRVSVNYYAGWSEPSEQFNLLTGPEYASLWNQAALNAGFNPTDNANLFYPDPESEPDAAWLDKVTTDRAFLQEMSANVSGGDDNTSFYFGGTYRDEDGWVQGTNLQRYSFRANVDQLIGKYFRAGIQLSPSRTVNNRQNEDNNVASPQTYSALAPPNIDPFDENGEVRGGLVPTSIGRVAFAGTPLSNLVGQDIVTTSTQVLANAYLEVRPIESIRLRTELGSQFVQVEDLYKAGGETTDGFGVDGTGSAANRQVLNWRWKNLLTYSDLLGANGDHSFTGTIGFEMQREEITAFDVAGNTFADDRLLTLNSAAEITGGGGSGTDVNFVGVLFLVDYAYKNKYLFKASFRIDGSSRFGANNRYGYFPAVSAGWIMSEEPWFDNTGFINFLKLRGSWGLTGNAGIGNFDARGLIAFGNDYNFVPGFAFDQLENADLTWETGETIDFGFEFELWRNRIRGSAAYFIRNTNDLLLGVPLPRTIGIVNSTINSNAGAIRNQGFEFNLDVDVLSRENFTWTIGVNGATLRNEVTELIDANNDGEADDIVGGTSIIRVGEPVRSFYLVPYAGVDPGTGDALFLGANGETIVNSVPSDARRILGNPLPDFSGGITTTLRFYGVDISAFFQYATGHQLYRSEGRFTDHGFSSGGGWNQRREVAFNSWTPENTNTDIPEARLFQNNGIQTSGRWISDADFIRLKNLQVGYTTPRIRNSDIRLRFFFSGQNLWLATAFEGLDPEATGQGPNNPFQGSIFFSRPQSRTFTFGVNLMN